MISAGDARTGKLVTEEGWSSFHSNGARNCSSTIQRESLGGMMCLQVKRRGGFALFMSPWIKCMRGELATGTGVVGWRGKSRLVLARLTNSVRINKIKK